MVTDTQALLRCDRCKHHFTHHGAQGCRVGKLGWDDSLRMFVATEKCPCKWYVGEMPPPQNPDACPHEVQVEIDPKTCIHCGKKVSAVE